MATDVFFSQQDADGITFGTEITNGTATLVTAYWHDRYIGRAIPDNHGWWYWTAGNRGGCSLEWLTAARAIVAANPGGRCSDA